jgi:5'-3' exoribonuclease 1
MGVPRFYRWLSERYPLINQVVDVHFKPEFDNLYLDMNGIIHGATHGEQLDPSKDFDLAQAMLYAFRYIDMLVKLAQPKKVLFLALDGPAPRAKMNQQRQRRFKSALEAQKTKQELLARKQITEKTVVFDSNAITPGTQFMTCV